MMEAYMSVLGQDILIHSEKADKTDPITLIIAPIRATFHSTSIELLRL